MDIIISCVLAAIFTAAFFAGFFVKDIFYQKDRKTETDFDLKEFLNYDGNITEDTDGKHYL